MSFADTERTTSNFTPRPRLKFLDTSSGKVTFRILEDSAAKFLTHYVSRTTVQCLGPECPICSNNKEIIGRNPKDFRQDPTYSPLVTRFAVNVLDKSLVRTCANCTNDNPTTLSACKSCGTFIGNEPPHVSNTVKILSKGVQLFDQLNSLNDAVLNTLGDRIGLKNFDINLIVSGTGRTTNYTTIPTISPQVMSGDTTTDLEGEFELFDLETAVLKLTADEILALRRGVAVKDLLIARGKSNADVGATPVASKEKEEELDTEAEDIRKQLDALLEE